MALRSSLLLTPTPHHWDDPFLDALEPVLAKFRYTKAREEAKVLLKAVRLAPTLEVCEALLRGERVPRARLDPDWRVRYGL